MMSFGLLSDGSVFNESKSMPLVRTSPFKLLFEHLYEYWHPHVTISGLAQPQKNANTQHALPVIHGDGVDLSVDA